jgi:hypothetical protein
MIQVKFGRLVSTKTLIRVVFAVLSVGLGVANAQSFSTSHQGSLDNTRDSLGGRYVGGGDGSGG